MTNWNKTVTERPAVPVSEWCEGFPARTEIVELLTIDHGIADDRGRACGGIAKVTTTTWDGGQQVTVSIYATRDGAHFGASPGSVTRPTRDAAIAHAEASLKRQGKSYAKKFPVGL